MLQHAQFNKSSLTHPKDRGDVSFGQNTGFALSAWVRGVNLGKLG